MFILGDKPIRKVVKCDNVKKVAPLAATTKQVITNTSDPLPVKRKPIQYSSDDENDNSSTGSMSSEGKPYFMSGFVQYFRNKFIDVKI